MRHGYFSRLAIRHPFGRWFPVLLAVLQLVAPLWHVCEMGGHCGECKPQSGALVCHIGNQETKSAVPRCKHCKSVAAVGADNRPGSFTGTCLARELMSMARVAIAPVVLNFQIARVRAPRPQHASRRAFFAFNLPLSRGPPAPFVV